MVETITPVVHGGSRSRWAAAVVVHTSAATLAAAAFGAVLGGAGGVLGAPWGSGGAVVVTVLAAWAFAHEALGVPFPVPQLRRQVPDWWRTFFSPFASATLYGAALGIGFFTYLLHATLVVVSAAAFVSGRPVVGAVIVGPFGLARGLSALVAVRGPDVVHTLASLARRRAPLAVLHALALVGIIATLEASVAVGPVAIRGLALAALAVAFAWSAAWKAVAPRAWREVLARYGLGRAARPLAMLIPTAEAGVVVLAAGGAARPAALLGLGLLAAFTVAAGWRWRADRGARLPCGCFGNSETSVVGLLVRNAVLALAGVTALSGAEPLDGRLLTGADVVPIVLSLAGVVGLLLAARSVRRSIAAGRV
jgi:methylamine utilization protein MauE